MAEETPQVEEPTEPKPEDVQTELNDVLSELKKIGVETPEQVQNLATAASQTGRAWNEVGDLRRKVQELEGRNQRPPRNEDYEYEQQPIDLRGEVRSVLKEFWNEQQEAQSRAYQQRMQEVEAIQGDQDFGLVKTAWDKHMSNPQTQMAVNSGQTSLSNEYNKLVRSYYRQIAIRSRDAIENVTKGAEKPPHVEKGGPAPPPPKPGEDEKKEKIKNVKENWTGSDADIDKALDAVFPKGDLSSMLGG